MSLSRSPRLILLCGGLILMIALGTRQSFGLFLWPMSTDLGWGREIFSFGIALQNLVWGIAMPFAGAVADRWGARRVLIGGGAAYAAGLAAMSVAGTAAGFNVAAGLLVGLGLSATGFGVVLAVVAKVHPPESRSMAVGIAGACGSFGQFAMLPAGHALISGFGWSTALLVLAGLAAMMIPLGAAMAGADLSRIQERQQSMSAAVAEAARHSGFLLATAAFFVCGFQTIFIMTHLPAYLVDRGFSDAQGMAALATIGLFNIVGSYACGALGGKYSKKLILAAIFAIRAVAIWLFIALPPSPLALYAFSAIVGATWLGTVPLTNALVGQIFGVRYLSTLFSICFLGHQLGAFAGAWLGGLAYDATNSYSVVWIGAIALSVAAALLCLPIDERPLWRVPDEGRLGRPS